jgi:putative ABC transport system substrate-binding protein
MSNVLRRHFVGLLAGAGAWPFAARAQRNPESPKVGYIYTGSKTLAPPRINAVVEGLRASGFAPAQVELVVRMTDGDPKLLEPMLTEVLDKKISVFIANGPAVLQAVRARSKTLPTIAVDFESDPVAAGYAASIARPGGNVTGVFLDFPNFAGKWIELLRECLPKLARVALISDRTGPVQIDALNKTAKALDIQTDLLEVKTRDDYAGAFAIAKDRGVGAAILLSTPMVPANARLLADLSLRHKLPTITMFSEFPRSGGLISYGANLQSATRQLGMLAGKVLAGTAPGNLPIERPTKFELIVNLKAADALGISIPRAILAGADETIE